MTTDYSLKLKYMTFGPMTMGFGLVGFKQTENEMNQGIYDPHVLFEHDKAQAFHDSLTPEFDGNPDIEAEIKKDCEELARLLNKFSIMRDFLKYNPK